MLSVEEPNESKVASINDESNRPIMQPSEHRKSSHITPPFTFTHYVTKAHGEGLVGYREN
jgi:hypothetical protein